MSIVQVCKDSFKIAAKSYRVLLKQFWWLILLSVSASLYCNFLALPGGRSFNAPYWVLYYVSIFLVSILTFIVILSMRSSKERKTLSYFWSYKSYVIPFFLGNLFLFPFRLLIVFFKFVVSLLPGLFQIWWKIQILTTGRIWTVQLFAILMNVFIAAFLITPLFIIFTLFLTDTKKGLGNIIISFKHALKMAFGNYFFCFSISIIWILLAWGIGYFVGTLGSYVFSINIAEDSYIVKSGILGLVAEYLVLLLTPLSYAFFVNLYNKRIKG